MHRGAIYLKQPIWLKIIVETGLKCAKGWATRAWGSLFCICLVWFLIALYSPKLDASFKVYNLIWCQQVITLEGWSDIMYFVQDAHSFWNWIYFVVLIVVRERLLRKYQTWIIMLSYFIPSCLSPTTLALPSLSLLSIFVFIPVFLLPCLLPSFSIYFRSSLSTSFTPYDIL